MSRTGGHSEVVNGGKVQRIQSSGRTGKRLEGSSQGHWRQLDEMKGIEQLVR